MGVDSALADRIADILVRIEINYHREGTGPDSRFESRRLEFVQACAVIREVHSAAIPEPIARPRIVVLCGSTRFYDAFREANLCETVAGRIVLSIGCDLRSDGDLWPDPAEREHIKAQLDELHKRKIDLADEVLVLNVGGYIGESTRSEIEYAVALGKPVRYWHMPGDHDAKS